MSEKKRKIKSPISYILILLGPLILSSCDLQSKDLLLVKKSAIANLELSNSHEVSRLYVDKDDTLGKPVYAHVQIEYEPISGYTKEELFEEIVNKIEENGWTTTIRDKMRYYSAIYRNESTNYLLAEVYNTDRSPNVMIIVTHR